MKRELTGGQRPAAPCQLLNTQSAPAATGQPANTATGPEGAGPTCPPPDLPAAGRHPWRPLL